MRYPNPINCASKGVMYNCEICAFTKDCPVLHPPRPRKKIKYRLIDVIMFLALIAMLVYLYMTYGNTDAIPGGA